MSAELDNAAAGGEGDSSTAISLRDDYGASGGVAKKETFEKALSSTSDAACSEMVPMLNAAVDGKEADGGPPPPPLLPLKDTSSADMDNHRKPEVRETGRGEAKIKSEFLDLNYKPRLEKDYLPREIKEKLQATEEVAETQEKIPEHADQPPAKKLRMKGRNKERPFEKKGDETQKLCPSVVNERVCSYGDRCRFNHNVTEFLASKPPDLGSECYLYKSYGKCAYGLACRYGSKHLSEDNKNLVDEKMFEQASKVQQVFNTLTKQVQVKLWKKKYDFSKANANIREIKEFGKVMNPDRGVKNIKKDNKWQSARDLKMENLAVSLANSVLPETSESVFKTATEEQIQEKVMPSDAEEAVLEVEETKDEKLNLQEFELDQADKDFNTELIQPVGNKEEISVKHSGCVTDTDIIRLRPQEKNKVIFSDKLYLAPLTTVGNLPYRRICKTFGADITCGEMAMASNLLQGQLSEWALLKRHISEDIFGVQVCGAYPDTMTRCAQLLNENIEIDFVDINCGCPIDLVIQKGAGCALMGRANRFEQIVKGMKSVLDVPLTVKMRSGISENRNTAHTILPKLRDWGIDLVTIHGRSREQRFTKLADWFYINLCSKISQPVPLFGSGDVLSYEDAVRRRAETGVSGLMIARGALLKPWIFTEIKEERHWDISSSERLDILKDFVNFGLEHWGSDQRGVDTTRRFLLEWLSFLHRYIPVGILERVPQKINERPPYYHGRDGLETLMASANCADWVRISEMLLGPVPEGFSFLPKHKANAYK